MGSSVPDPEYTEEEVVSETVYEGEAAPPTVHDNTHLHPPSHGLQRGIDAPPRAAAGENVALMRPDTKVALETRKMRLQIAEARLKGYEGDACGGCGAFTLVRNGTCLKCVSCGATSGCS